MLLFLVKISIVKSLLSNFSYVRLLYDNCSPLNELIFNDFKMDLKSSSLITSSLIVIINLLFLVSNSVFSSWLICTELVKF